jgi:hypothetical protein
MSWADLDSFKRFAPMIKVDSQVYPRRRRGGSPVVTVAGLGQRSGLGCGVTHPCSIREVEWGDGDSDELQW